MKTIITGDPKLDALILKATIGLLGAREVGSRVRARAALEARRVAAATSGRVARVRAVAGRVRRRMGGRVS